MTNRYEEQVHAALAVAADASISREDRSDMLVEIAIGLQHRPASSDQLLAAVLLYDKALDLRPTENHLFIARTAARKATALQALPDTGHAFLEQARDIYLEVIPVLTRFGLPEEVAEAEMNFGLVLQALAGMNRARVADAIGAYHRALRVFDRRHPVEFAILQNNLATAFLSAPLSDEHGKVREAMAVQSFEEGLKVVTLADHPREYAMLQNNLGNALQYALSSHPLENNLRALEAYDEALKVRTARDAPLEYANTIANKANCLLNLPDDPGNPEGGNPGNLGAARAYFMEARQIFSDRGEMEKLQVADEAIREIDRAISAPETAG